MPQNWLQLAIFFAVFYAVMLSVRRRREAIRLKLRRLILTLGAYFGVIVYVRKIGWETVPALFAGIAAGLIVDRFIPGRSRYIPASVRKNAIASFESRTGQKYNRRLHEFDHNVPFSKGGSNTADNIRISTRRKNRSKGAKSPWWDLLSR